MAENQTHDLKDTITTRIQIAKTKKILKLGNATKIEAKTPQKEELN